MLNTIRNLLLKLLVLDDESLPLSRQLAPLQFSRCQILCKFLIIGLVFNEQVLSLLNPFHVQPAVVIQLVLKPIHVLHQIGHLLVQIGVFVAEERIFHLDLCQCLPHLLLLLNFKLFCLA